MAKKRGLGKGLDALIGQAKENRAVPSVEQTVQAGERLLEIAVDKIQRGQYQPRQYFDDEALSELADSIKQQGLLQPIVLRPLTSDSYEIIAGERRWRACQLIGMDKIPAIIKTIDDESAIALAIIENLQREDLNPVEEALALQRLQKEFGLSQQQVAEAVGKPRSTVANILRLTSLHPGALDFLERGDIETGHAKCLLGLEKQQQLSAARYIVSRALTVRQAEAYIRKLQQPTTDTANAEKEKNADVKHLENRLSELLAAKVEIKQSSAKKGKLLVHYNSLDELDGILKHIK